MESEYHSIWLKEMIVHNAKKQPAMLYLKYISRIIVLLIFALSIVFKENFWKSFNWPFLLLLFAVLCSTSFIGKRKITVESDMEIQLHSDCLVLYRPHIVYSKRMERREYNRVNYNELEKIVYKTNNEACYIYGDVEMCWTRYCSGQLQEKPYKHEKIKKTLLFFNTNFIDMDKFIEEVEKNSDIKIIKE